jgi:phosphoenolpyruvate synthase/pyruvate phosphate dikinase
VGHKSANLARLFHRRNIPNGFCIPVSVFERFLEANHLNEMVRCELAAAAGTTPNALVQASERIRRSIRDADMPHDACLAIDQGYAALKSSTVAVRSSSTGEDTSDASSAGMQETFLNVSNESVLTSIKLCWGSFFSPRAISYREILNIGPNEASMAVLIQEMVPAKYAGVVFSVHPVKRHDILLEVVEGNGDQLVSGITTPNQYWIERARFQSIHTRELFEIDRRILIEIASEAVALEEFFGQPMDIEFVVDYRQIIWIVQARPITTLTHRNC